MKSGVYRHRGCKLLLTAALACIVPYTYAQDAEPTAEEVLTAIQEPFKAEVSNLRSRNALDEGITLLALDDTLRDAASTTMETYLALGVLNPDAEPEVVDRNLRALAKVSPEMFKTLATAAVSEPGLDEVSDKFLLYALSDPEFARTLIEGLLTAKDFNFPLPPEENPIALPLNRGQEALYHYLAKALSQSGGEFTAALRKVAAFRGIKSEEGLVTDAAENGKALQSGVLLTDALSLDPNRAVRGAVELLETASPKNFLSLATLVATKGSTEVREIGFAGVDAARPDLLGFLEPYQEQIVKPNLESRENDSGL